MAGGTYPEERNIWQRIAPFPSNHSNRSGDGWGEWWRMTNFSPENPRVKIHQGPWGQSMHKRQEHVREAVEQPQTPGRFKPRRGCQWCTSTLQLQCESLPKAFSKVFVCLLVSWKGKSQLRARLQGEGAVACISWEWGRPAIISVFSANPTRLQDPQWSWT